MWRRALMVWLLIVLAESIHGALRELFVKPVLGDLLARQLGVFTGSLLILLIATLTARWLMTNNDRQRLVIGAAWVILMVCFEVGLGIALGATRERILSDYDFSQGGLMVLGLIVLLFAPLIGARIRPPAP